jgi:hypothetical protein
VSKLEYIDILSSAYLWYIEPLYRLLRNPAVNIEPWHEPVESDESDAGDPLAGEELVDGDQDPQFAERMAPLDFDALDEPGVGHEELAAFLEAHLLDMDEDEWIDLCKSLHFVVLPRLILILSRFPGFVKEGCQDP